MKNGLKLGGLAAIAALALAACGGSSGGSDDSGASSSSMSSMDMSTHATSAPTTSAPTTSAATGAPASAASITISNFSFAPGTLTVAPGATITVTNNDSVPHDVDSNDQSSFQTEPVSNGGTFTFTAPMEKGSYGFHCSVHPNMKGTLIVA